MGILTAHIHMLSHLTLQGFHPLTGYGFNVASRILETSSMILVSPCVTAFTGTELTVGTEILLPPQLRF